MHRTMHLRPRIGKMAIVLAIEDILDIANVDPSAFVRTKLYNVMTQNCDDDIWFMFKDVIPSPYGMVGVMSAVHHLVQSGLDHMLVKVDMNMRCFIFPGVNGMLVGIHHILEELAKILYNEEYVVRRFVEFKEAQHRITHLMVLQNQVDNLCMDISMFNIKPISPCNVPCSIDHIIGCMQAL